MQSNALKQRPAAHHNDNRPMAADQRARVARVAEEAAGQAPDFEEFILKYGLRLSNFA